jgi:NAD(P)-dependent dehydrogenase (short-subunit alcohol dehydrogenase family)
MRQELAPHRVGVSTICPGVVDTGIVAAMRMRGGEAAESRRADYVSLYRRRGFGPAGVARAILDAVAKNRAVVPVTPEAWAMYLGKRLMPETALGLGRWVFGKLARGRKEPAPG